ncbi:P-II family nitrogen regulator [Hominifimenecus sp. rT4P-3]|uniref:P-II family nitrogen regulator n=1 Tax=Hominifimenecus sp. rT4P-3 TaxID=3242979 RepID=UPI003DA21A43
MKDIYFLTTIIRREQISAYAEFFNRHEVCALFGSLCHGTAQSKTLAYLGLERTEKLMLVCLLPGQLKERVLRGLVSEMGINVAGSGIALTIPVSSIAGTSSLKFLLGNQEITSHISEGGNDMKEENFALIITIAERGCSDIVMDAARKANAAGGTVVHAKGTGAPFSSKFFGISLADEKDFIYIVAKRQDKDHIMRTIVENAGMHTKAHAAVFSLPVDDVVGLRSVLDEE